MFLSCGDALFDMFADRQSPLGTVAIDGRVGGSPLNVALGLSRLGNESAYFTLLSKDLFGRRIAEFMAANCISARFCPPTDRLTTLAMVELQADGSAAYAFYIDGPAARSIELSHLPADLGDDVQVLHLASYSTVTEPTASSLEALVSREAGRRFISYDPNLRTMIEPDIDLWRHKVASLSHIAHFVKASDEDLHQLYGNRPFDAFAADCIAAGTKLVCVTRGASGALAFSADGRQTAQPGKAVSVVDTVGAGDTFQAASLHWLGAHGLLDADKAASADLDSLLRFAIAAAGVTCSRRGADLPALADVEAALN